MADYIHYYHQLIEILEKSKDMKDTVFGRQSLMLVIWIVFGAVIGGYLGQIIGVLIGAVAGFFIANYMYQRYETMLFVLKNLTDTEKLELVIRIQACVRSQRIDDFAKFIETFSQRDSVIPILAEFVDTKLRRGSECKADDTSNTRDSKKDK